MKQRFAMTFTMAIGLALVFFTITRPVQRGPASVAVEDGTGPFIRDTVERIVQEYAASSVDVQLVEGTDNREIQVSYSPSDETAILGPGGIREQSIKIIARELSIARQAKDGDKKSTFVRFIPRTP